MDEAVVTVVFADVEAVEAVTNHLDEHGSVRPHRAVVRTTPLFDRCAGATAILLDPDCPPILIEGFLVSVLFAVIEADPDSAHQAGPLLEAMLCRASIPSRNALGYVRAVRAGGALLALRAQSSDIEQTCQDLGAAGVRATSVHHCPESAVLEQRLR